MTFIVESFDVSPLETVVDVIVIVGEVESSVQVKLFDAVLLFPAESVKVFSATLIVYVASPDGVNIAVYVVPEPVKSDKAPPLIVISPTTKLVVASFDVNVSEIIGSFDVSPLETVDYVIVIVGLVESKIHVKLFDALLLFPEESENLFCATLIVQVPSVVGVKVAV